LWSVWVAAIRYVPAYVMNLGVAQRIGALGNGTEFMVDRRETRAGSRNEVPGVAAPGQFGCHWF